MNRASSEIQGLTIHVACAGEQRCCTWGVCGYLCLANNQSANRRTGGWYCDRCHIGGQRLPGESADAGGNIQTAAERSGLVVEYLTLRKTRTAGWCLPRNSANYNLIYMLMYVYGGRGTAYPMRGCSNIGDSHRSRSADLGRAQRIPRAGTCCAVVRHG